MTTKGMERDLTTLYSMKPDGSDQVPIISDNPDKAISSAELSPDGSSVIFEAMNGYWLQDKEVGQGIVVANADGTGGRTVLKRNLFPAPPSQWGYYHIFSARWSPDGKMLTFHIQRDDKGYAGTDVFVAKADGSQMRPLTDDHASGGPVWRPDGTHIEFERNDGIYVVDLDGKTVTKVRDAVSGQGRFWLSPDGTKVAYTMIESDKGDTVIYVADSDGSNAVPITSLSDGRSWFPVWSPNGTEIAFTTKRNGNTDVYVVGADGKGERRLTSDPADEFVQDWGPKRSSR